MSILEVKDSFLSDDSVTKMLGKTSSKGAQEKWFNPEKDIYLKKDFMGYESTAEVVVSKIQLNCTNLDRNILVKYKLCTIDGVLGCYSKNFKTDNEQEISLRRIMKLQAGSDSALYLSNNATENLKIIVENLFKYTGKDFTNELKTIFAVDSFFLNEDRHAANLSILFDGINYRISPIYDNGMALLSNLNLYPEGINVNTFKHDVKSYLPYKSFKSNALLYNLEPFVSEKLVKEFIVQYKKEIPRICKLLDSQLKEKHIQPLLIKEHDILDKSTSLAPINNRRN